MKKTLLLGLAALMIAGLSHAAQIKGVTASGYDETNGHKPANAIDGNDKTRWAAQGKETWIILELAQSEKIENVVLVPFRETERSLKFSLYASEDQKNWRKIGENLSTSKAHAAGEKFTFPATTARYIKVVANGTDVNNWSAINEILINGGDNIPQRQSNS